MNNELDQAKSTLEVFLNKMNQLEIEYANPITDGLLKDKDVTDLEKAWIEKVTQLYNEYVIEYKKDYYRPIGLPATYDLSRDSITNIEKNKNIITIHYKQITGVVEQDMIFYLKNIEGKYKIEKLTYFDQFKNKWIKRYI